MLQWFTGASSLRQRMLNPLDYPLLLFALLLPLFWLSSRFGTWLHGKTGFLGRQDPDYFKFILGGTLTLLGLLVGFSFAMAVSRYDLRISYEEQEANAIGTEYFRTSLLPSADRAKVCTLLPMYLDERIRDYAARDEQELGLIGARTKALQTQLWLAVSVPVSAEPNPLNTIAVSGMNDVFSAQGSADSAWSNRIPAAAWILLIAVAIFCNFLVGAGARESPSFLFLILPIVLSISLFLIADIDSPRHGIIHVQTKDLEALARSLCPR